MRSQHQLLQKVRTKMQKRKEQQTENNVTNKQNDNHYCEKCTQKRRKIKKAGRSPQ
jgi:hypothetical protein